MIVPHCHITSSFSNSYFNVAGVRYRDRLFRIHSLHTITYHFVELPQAMARHLHLSYISDLSSAVESSPVSLLSISTYQSLAPPAGLSLSWLSQHQVTHLKLAVSDTVTC